MKLLRAITTVAGLTGVSRIAGFVRDVLTASILGAGPVADAFFVALKLPNLFRRITAEGAFSVSFVPVYSQISETQGRAAADKFGSQAFSMMLLVLSVLSVAAIWLMPLIISAIAPGFAGDPLRYDLAVEFSRTTFPYLVLMSLTALLGGILNALDRFAPFAFAPVLFNLCLITALFFHGFADSAGHALAIGVLCAGVLQLSWLLVCALRAGVRIRLVVPRFSKPVIKVFRLMGPGVIGAGVMHLNLFADMVIASFLGAGSISYLYYADRLNQLPLGMLGIGVGTALLPMLSKTLSTGKVKQAKDLFNKALEFSLLLTLPAAAGLFVIAWPIVVTLFHHGSFTWDDAVMTRAALGAYAIGIPSYISVKVFSTVFWASQDTKTPVKVSVVSTAFNIFLSLWLVFYAGAGVAGIALATSLAGWLQVGLFIYMKRGIAEAKFEAKFLKNLARILVSTGVMAAFLYVAQTYSSVYFTRGDTQENEWLQIIALACLVLGGGIVYTMSVFLTGLFKVRDVISYLKKGLKT